MRVLLLSSCVLSLLPSSLLGDELDVLIQEYNRAKAQAGSGFGPGGPGGPGRGEPSNAAGEALEKIGRLGSDAALKFLLDEIARAPQELAVAAAGAALRSSHPRGQNLVLGLLGKRPAKVSIAILEAIIPPERPAGGGRWAGRRQRREPIELEWKKVEKELVAAAREVKEVEVKRRLIPVLARGEGAAAAGAILQVAASGVVLRAGEEEVHARAVEALVKLCREGAARQWLEKEAFSLAGSNPGMLAAAIEAAGLLEAGELRPRIVEFLPHDVERVAGAAVEALSRLPGTLSEQQLRIVRRQLGRKQGSTKERARILDGLARDGGPQCMALLLESARSSDPVTRAIAMGSLALAAGGPEVARALLAGLEDKTVEVRSIALRSLRKTTEKLVIPGLIAYLETESVDRLKADALRLLVELTGHNMGFVAADWRKWWELAEKDFQLAGKKKQAAAGTQVAASTYFGIEVASKRLAFLLGVSLSMESRGAQRGGRRSGEKSKLDLLKEELTRLLKEMGDDSQINIITFDGTVRSWSDQLRPLSRGGREKAVEFVLGLRTAPQTNVFDSLELALKDRRLDTIYLLTDGQPTTGRYVDTAGILKGVEELNRVRGVTVHCIAFGEESELLKQLAEQNGGIYRFVQETAEG
jgi:HEAT repeat protein